MILGLRNFCSASRIFTESIVADYFAVLAQSSSSRTRPSSAAIHRLSLYLALCFSSRGPHSKTKQKQPTAMVACLFYELCQWPWFSASLRIIAYRETLSLAGSTAGGATFNWWTSCRVSVYVSCYHDANNINTPKDSGEL